MFALRFLLPLNACCIFLFSTHGLDFRDLSHYFRNSNRNTPSEIHRQPLLTAAATILCTTSTTVCFEFESRSRCHVLSRPRSDPRYGNIDLVREKGVRESHIDVPWKVNPSVSSNKYFDYFLFSIKEALQFAEYIGFGEVFTFLR